LRLIVPVMLVLAVTGGAFLVTRMEVNHDARRDAGNRADIAATEVRNGIEQAANLVESLRRFMLGHAQASVTNAQFVDIGARWLSPVGLPAAAWVKEVPGGRGLRATLVTGASPMTAPGIDLGDEPVVAAAIAEARTLFRVTATPLARAGDGRPGLFLVESAPRLSQGVLEPGYLVLFIPASWLFTAVTAATQETNARLRLRIGDTSYGSLGKAAAVGSTFTAGGRRFDVLVPEKRVRGAAALLPWVVLGAGIVLALFTGAVATIAERRGRARREVQRIFNLSPDLIAVADFDGFWKRVNPAFETLLGYTEREALARPYLDFVHPADREGSEAAARRILEGEATFAFENRIVCKDGTYRWIEWTAAAVPKEGELYGVGRDITERRRSESEQTALRRVATLVAEGVEPQDLFAVVAQEIARVIDVPLVRVLRYEPDDAATQCASFSVDGTEFPFGEQSSLEGTSVVRLVRETSEAARIDDYAGLEGEIAEIARARGIRSGVGAPIVVAGRLWGAVVVSSYEQLPQDTAARLSDFTELLATAIASAESHGELKRVVDEQAALRRVATLVAQGVPPADIFAAVSNEVSGVSGVGAAVLRFDDDGPAVVFIGVGDGLDIPIGTRWEFQDGMASAEVYRTGRSARVDAMDWSSGSGSVAATARRLGILSTVVSPIVVEGRLWGAMSLSSSDKLLPPDAEERLEKFTQILATAIANAESREARARLVDEQAALRRVATLVAQGVPPEELFAAVIEEVGQLLPVGSAAMGRLDPDGMFTTVAAWSTAVTAFPVGARWIPEGKNVTTIVYETGRPARIDDFADASGPVGVAGREAGYRSAVGTPIVVEGRVWGVMTAASSAEEPLPSDTEVRLSSFTELVATAIANAETTKARRRLAEQQAALRRVATLVAEGVQPPDLFAVMAEEIGRVSEVEATSVVRYEADGTALELANYRLGSPKGLFPVGVRMNIEGVNILRLVRDSSKAARIDDYSETHGEMAEIVRRSGIKSTVGVPIIVAGRVWGVMVGSTTEPEPLPEDTASRMTEFTELLATAIENSESREALERLAEEQAALRRMATLVARGVPPAEIFSAVCDEVASLFGTDVAGVARFDHADQALVFVGAAPSLAELLPVGTRSPLDDAIPTAQVYRTGRSVRVDMTDFASLPGDLAAAARRLGVTSTVASPIVVEGRLWGATTVSSKEELPADAEQRLENFSDLIATAVANADSKSELAASRRRIVAASDQTRRQIERDLHDGTQQRLVSLELGLRAAEADLPPDRPELRAELARVAGGLAEAVEELRELSRGIHPAILSEGGLGPALRTLARRSRVPVELDTHIDRRLPERLEVAAYYVASEALTNVAKHAHASVVRVDVREQNGTIRLLIRDDGIGGVDPGRGSGLVGLQDRVEALGGKITIDSAPGNGTLLVATLPLDDETAGAVD
jgi:PAS domain S-box-containing protein